MRCNFMQLKDLQKIKNDAEIELRKVTEEYKRSKAHLESLEEDKNALQGLIFSIDRLMNN